MFFLGFNEITLFLWLLANILPDYHIVVNVFYLFLVGVLFCAPETRYLIVFEILWCIPVLWSDCRKYITAGNMM
jgi:hypothetical protein